MISNNYRKGISDADARAIISKFCPEVTDVEELEELWECVIEASKEATISKALAVLADRDHRIVLELHQANPWTPSPSEAVLLKAFSPNYFNAILLTAVSKNLFDARGNLTDEFLEHVDNVCEEVRLRAEKELDALRRGA